MELVCYQKSRLGFPSWSSSDSTFCRLRWCPGLLGVSASRLLCFFPTGGGHSAVVLTPSLLLSPSRKCLLPQFQPESATKSSPPLSQSLWPRASLSFLFQQVPNYSLNFLTLSHTALLTLKLAKPIISKMATSPILELEAGGLWDTHKL